MLSLKRICAVLIGLVFAFSSVFKLMDPVGTGLIVESYFQFLHLDFMRPAAKIVGVMLSFLEGTLCIALITGVWQRITALATMSLAAFFLVISVLLVIFNPDMSCGCFGKVWELTHVQTLIKNLILIALACFAFLPLSKLCGTRADRYVSFSIAELSLVVFAIYFLLKIPILDYSEFAESHTVVSEENAALAGAEYPTLPLWDDNGEYCSELLLGERVVAVSIYKPEKLDNSGKNEIAGFVQDALNAGWTPLVLSSGSIGIPGAEVYTADYKKLVTLNRSNGGLVFLDNGYIMRKYARYDYPSFEELEEMYQADPVEIYVDCSTRESLVLQGLFLAILAIMFFV